MRCFSTVLLEQEPEESYPDYFNRLYEVFCNEILNKLSINDKPVQVKKHFPEGLDREDAFYHLTCTDYNKQLDNRVPDFNRSKRIRLIKPIVGNYFKCPSCSFNDCSSILVWQKNFKGKPRLHLYLVEMDYIVVLEERPKYFLLVTAFYVYPLKKEHYLEEHSLYAI